MKWLLAEDWSTPIYAEPFYNRLAQLGEEVYAFKESSYSQTPVSGSIWATCRKRWINAQFRLLLGPGVLRLNLALLRKVDELRPDVLFLFRGGLAWPSTLAAVKQRGVHLVGWHNDNPFSPAYPWYVWQNFRWSIPTYDRLYAYRKSNVDDFARAGCKRAGQLRSFFVSELNFPVTTPQLTKYVSDVSFCGHWEPDGRDDYIAAILDVPDVNFRLWGPLWDRSPHFPQIKKRFGQIEILGKEDYNFAVNGTKIGLVFLSGLNRDTYTRRCFEIPATGTFMLAQYTPDLAEMFAEGIEAEYFRSPAELITKIRFYLRNESDRARVAAAGQARLQRDGHEAIDRARQVRDDVYQDLGKANFVP